MLLGFSLSDRCGRLRYIRRGDRPLPFSWLPKESVALLRESINDWLKPLNTRSAILQNHTAIQQYRVGHLLGNPLGNRRSNLQGT